MDNSSHNLEKTLDEAQEGLRNQTERLQIVCDVSHLLSSNWDLQQVFPQISASIRRTLRHEFASFVLHDPNTGLLVRQALDFPLGKGILEALQVVTPKSPSGLAMQERAIKVFSREELLGGRRSREQYGGGRPGVCVLYSLAPSPWASWRVSCRKHTTKCIS